MTSVIDQNPRKSREGGLSRRPEPTARREVTSKVQWRASGKSNVDENAVLRQVLQRVGEELGLNERVLAQAVGEVPSFFDPGQATSPIAPSTYQRIGLMLRLHDSLSSLMGNDVEHMRGWMGALNRHTGGIPAKQLKDPDQLGKLVGYLEVFDC